MTWCQCHYFGLDRGEGKKYLPLNRRNIDLDQVSSEIKQMLGSLLLRNIIDGNVILFIFGFEWLLLSAF